MLAVVLALLIALDSGTGNARVIDNPESTGLHKG